MPGVDHAALAERVRSDAAAIGARHGVTFAVDVVDDRPCAVTPEDHPIALAVARAHRDVTGVEPAFGGVPGATDGTILWRDSGIPNVVYGPGPKWIAHQPDEYVEVDDVVRKTRVYAEAALVFLTGATVAEAGGAL